MKCRPVGRLPQSDGIGGGGGLQALGAAARQGSGACPPVITGATGMDRIFDEYPDVGLELVDSRLFDGKLQLLEYVPSARRTTRR
jgi:hypothetical protein